MMRASAAIREKPNWHEKFRDPAIRARWKEEAVAAGMRADAFEYVLAELERYEALRKGGIEVAGVDGVWIADGLVPDGAREALLRCAAELEDVPEEKKDWHPGSDGQVLDLVHPSLFCLVYGIVQPPGDELVGASKAYQWLPTEFDVAEDGKVSALSYVPGLHPEERQDMYSTLCRILQAFIPLFNNALTDLVNRRPARIEVDPYAWYGEEPDFEDDDDAVEDWYENRVPAEPAVPEYAPPPDPETVIDLKGHRLQVIVKLANIVLTPEKPDYPGGSWHVEGTRGENIIASGIFYYESENIGESRLGFRMAVCEPDYEQSDDNGVLAIYGLANDQPLNQELGSVATTAGRMLVFPNHLQHRVAPFSLADRSKPGHRKILVFFLVNPKERIRSTAEVPPQDAAWFADELRRVPPFDGLPDEMTEQIVAAMPFPISLREAMRHREELMTERKFMSDENENIFERPFSLCEH
ncbi:hypothetical protein DFJ74DRAFT_699223 [Hyaloraphidium curvatum]|nr:hypothetical protein DFJ74DRAFT_699223 [Hyaloraphidium curvatum]